ncbi:MAG TPA: PAS domain-containing protein [Micropepsaceae bacterium]|nr:PAS domain-containing protein [Micropepsaceae bacterium]
MTKLDSQSALSFADLRHGAFVPIAEAMPAMVWLGDTQGQCVYLNKALRDFWGIETSDLPRFSWASTLVPEDRDVLFGVVTKAMEDRVAFTVRARYRRADGAIRILETKAEPRFAKNGEFLGMVGINADVTDAGGAD